MGLDLGGGGRDMTVTKLLLFKTFCPMRHLVLKHAGRRIYFEKNFCPNTIIYAAKPVFIRTWNLSLTL